MATKQAKAASSDCHWIGDEHATGVLGTYQVRIAADTSRVFEQEAEMARDAAIAVAQDLYAENDCEGPAVFDLQVWTSNHWEPFRVRVALRPHFFIGR